MQISYCINKINSKKYYFDGVKSTKWSKDQREERMILFVLLFEWSIKLYIRVTDILSCKSDLKIFDEIKVIYECVIKIT